MAAPETFAAEGWLTNVAVAIGTGIGATIAYLLGRRGAPPEKPVANLHIGDAQITDMGPVDRLRESVEQLAVTIGGRSDELIGKADEILEVMKQHIADQKADRLREMEAENERLRQRLHDERREPYRG